MNLNNVFSNVFLACIFGLFVRVLENLENINIGIKDMIYSATFSKILNEGFRTTIRPTNNNLNAKELQSTLMKNIRKRLVVEYSTPSFRFIRF